MRWLNQQVSSLSGSMVAHCSTEQVPVQKQREQFEAIPHKFDPALFYGGTKGWCGNRIGQDKTSKHLVSQEFVSVLFHRIYCQRSFLTSLDFPGAKPRLFSKGCRFGLELCEVPILVRFSCGIQGRRRNDGMIHVNSCHCSLRFCLFFFRQGQCWRHHWAAKAWKAEEALRCTNCHTQPGHRTIPYAALLGSDANIRTTCNMRTCHSAIDSSQQFFESQRKVTLIRCLAWNKWARRTPPIWQQP